MFNWIKAKSYEDDDRTYIPPQANRFVDVVSDRCDLMRVMLDKETGVQYIVMSTGGITPLIGADGKPVLRERDHNA